MAQIRAINRYSVRKFEAFVSAIGDVAEALLAVRYIIDQMDDDQRRISVQDVFTFMTPDELNKILSDALGSLDRIHSQAKKHEGELLSRDWRL